MSTSILLKVADLNSGKSKNTKYPGWTQLDSCDIVADLSQGVRTPIACTISDFRDPLVNYLFEAAANGTTFPAARIVFDSSEHRTFVTLYSVLVSNMNYREGPNAATVVNVDLDFEKSKFSQA
jgi:hypothetical protein